MASAHPHANIRQQVPAQVTKAGATDVTVTPSSFLVRAEDKQGNPVAPVIGQESFTEAMGVAPGKGGTQQAAKP